MQLFGHQARMLCLAGTIFSAPPQTIPSTAHVVRLQGLFSSVGPGKLVKEEMLEDNLNLLCEATTAWLSIYLQGQLRPQSKSELVSDQSFPQIRY